MAATATAPRSASREGPAERLVEFIVLGGMALLVIAAVLPLALVGIAAYGALHALRRRSWRIKGPAAALCLLPAPVAFLVAYVAHRTMPMDVVMGFVDVQLDAAAELVALWQSGRAFDWLAYGLAVAPYAGAGGATVGAAIASFRFVSAAIPGYENAEERTELKITDAAQLKDEAVTWGVPDVVGRKVISLLSAPPGGGKGWWLWGLARAMQDGTSFYGLPAHRMKILWCTEEGTSFARTRARFGVNKGLVEVLHRHEVRGWDWPSLVKAVRKEAWRRKCGIVIFDTVRAWCPEAEQTPEHANAVMHVARRELTGPGLGALFVHHDTKAGGQHGAGVSGTYALVGAVDVLIELKRVSDDPADPRRRMVTSRRFEPLDLTATLDGHRYVLLPGQGQKTAARAAVQEAVRNEQLPPAKAKACARCGAPADEWHHTSYAPGDELDVTPLCKRCHTAETTDTGATLRSTVDAVRAGGELTTEAFMAALKIGKAAASARLNAAEAAGLVERSGRGGRSGPQVWRLTSDAAHQTPGV